MAFRFAALLAAASLCSAAALLRATPEAADACPYGYGDGCDHFWDGVGEKEPAAGADGKLDPALKAKLSDILGGLITSLSSKPVPRLVAVSHGVVRSSEALSGRNGATHVLGSLLSSLQQRSTTGAAALLTRLGGSKVDAGEAIAVSGYLADTLAADATSCPFGYGCGGAGDIDPATKAQVANILNGIIKNLSAGHRKPEAPKDPEVRRALGSLLATLQSSYSANGAAVLDALTNVEGQQVDTAAVATSLAQVVKSTDPCSDFGYGCGGGGGGPISSATKAKVASILNGIIKNLGGSHR